MVLFEVIHPNFNPSAPFREPSLVEIEIVPQHSQMAVSQTKASPPTMAIQWKSRKHLNAK